MLTDDGVEEEEEEGEDVEKPQSTGLLLSAVVAS